MLQVKNKIRSGKSVQVFPAGREANTSSCGEKIEPDKIISGATLCNRTRPCGTAPESGSTIAGEPTIIIHENGGDDTGQVISSYLRSSGIVHRAMRLFEEWNYHPARISSSKIPVDILAIRKDTVLLVQVISSRATVLDAASMTGQYGEKI